MNDALACPIGQPAVSIFNGLSPGETVTSAMLDFFPKRVEAFTESALPAEIVNGCNPAADPTQFPASP